MFTTKAEGKISCPICNTNINLAITIQRKDDDWNMELFKIWNEYLVWKLCGEPKYGSEQLWYDYFSTKVKFEPSETPGYGTVYFTIETFPSPEGNSWLHVKVPLKNGSLRLDEKVEKYIATSSYCWDEVEQEAKKD